MSNLTINLMMFVAGMCFFGHLQGVYTTKQVNEYIKASYDMGRNSIIEEVTQAIYEDINT